MRRGGLRPEIAPSARQGSPAIAFRILHSADLHLDSPLRSLALRDPDLAALIGTATRAALERLVEICLEERVDALTLGGDLYDDAQASMKTARALVEAFRRLEAAGVPVLAIRGNHDAAARITGPLAAELPGNVHVFGRKPATRRLEAGGVAVAVHGVSFTREAPAHPLAGFPAPVAGAVNIGLLHTSLGGAAGHDPYAPVSLAELAAVGYDAWLLGHVHARQLHPGPPLVLMPGMPQGRDIGEAGPKSASLIAVEADGRMTVEERPTAVAEFARAEVALAGLADWGGVEAALEAALAGEAARGAAAHRVLRLRLTGATPLAWRLRRDLDAVEEAAGRLAAGAGGRTRLWVEAVETGCTPPRAAGAGGALEELAALVEGPAPPAEAAAGRALWDEILRGLPAELREDLPAEPEAVAALLAELRAEGIADVLARLHETGAEG